MYFKGFGLLTVILLLTVIFLIIISNSHVFGIDVRANIGISDLKASTGAKYEVAKNLQVGDKEYTDRDYIFKSLPDYLKGLTWIRTANGDKKTNPLEVSFKIDKEAYIYIAWVARDPAAQDWLQANYTKIDGEIGSTDEALSIYKSKKTFPPGEVKTYQAGTNAGMYVIIIEAVTPSPVNLLRKTTITWGNIKRN